MIDFHWFSLNGFSYWRELSRSPLFDSPSYTKVTFVKINPPNPKPSYEYHISYLYRTRYSRDQLLNFISAILGIILV